MEMMQLVNEKYGTPVSYQKCTSKLPNKIFWPQENFKDKSINNNLDSINYTKVQEEWDNIESPQYVDFNDASDISDSTFFDAKSEDEPLKQNPNAQQLPTTDILIESFHNICSFKDKEVPANITTKNNIKYKDINLKEKVEKCTQKISNGLVKSSLQNNIKDKTVKPHCTAVVPFSFDSQDKYRQERKQEHIRKLALELQNKTTTFKAQPVPKFLKTTAQSTSNGRNNTKTEQVNYKNGEKPINKPKEVWKRKPFLPCPPKRHLQPPKAPRLLTADRAEKRMEIEKGKEKLKEMECRQRMETLFKKKQQQKQITCPSNSAAHILKRPLTDPITPLCLKRRRLHGASYG